MAIKKRKRDSVQPCLTPVNTWNFSVASPPCNTLQVIPSLVALTIEMCLFGIPQCLMIFHSESLSTLSNVFLKSMNLMYNEHFHFNDCSIIILNVAIWSGHDRSFLNPA